MKKKLLSILLHHANRETKSPNFYAIKNRLVKKYGELIGYDVQHIPGKTCNSCGGRGQHPRYGYNGKIYDWADCYHCNWGWYKLPEWNILERYRFEKYIFHQPLKRVYSKEAIDVPIGCKIDGYIEHRSSKWGLDCLILLYIIFDFKRWWKEYQFKYTYHYQWNTPWRFINNVLHIIQRGKGAIPIQHLQYNWRHKRQKTKPAPIMQCDTDDLPF